MPLLIDMTGSRFGRLLVIHYDSEDRKWVCACDCGNQTRVTRINLMNGHVKSCGCLGRESRGQSLKGKPSSQREDLSGKRFGNLVAIEYDRPYVHKGEISGSYWKVRCDCGKVLTTRKDTLKRGRITSCGCYRAKARKDFHAKNPGYWSKVSNRPPQPVTASLECLCEYGCGQPARYVFRNGKYCCSSKESRCPERAAVRSATRKKFEEEHGFPQSEVNRRPEVCLSKRASMTERWKDPVFQQKIHAARALKPNKLERSITDLLGRYGFRYSGDYSYWIGGKNPDFVNEESKKIVEVFGDYWHSAKVGNVPGCLQERARIRHFSDLGYECLVLWEFELKDPETLNNKVNAFVGK